MTDKAHDIKSCPFCGRGSQLEARESAWQKKTRFAVRCTTSKCPGHPKDPAEYATKEEAIKNWNRRNGVESTTPA